MRLEERCNFQMYILVFWDFFNLLDHSVEGFFSCVCHMLNVKLGANE